MNFHIIAYTPHGSFSGCNSQSSTWLDRSVFVMLAPVETVLYACTEENVNDEIPKADDDDDEGELVGWL